MSRKSTQYRTLLLHFAARFPRGTNQISPSLKGHRLIAFACIALIRLNLNSANNGAKNGAFAAALYIPNSSNSSKLVIFTFTSFLAILFQARHIAAMPATPHSISSSSHNNFIQHFTQGESHKRVTKKQPKALTAVQRAGLRRQLKTIGFLKPAYADNSKINITGILRKWKK